MFLCFLTCKVSVNAFSLIYSNLLLAKLCLFVFGAPFAASHWQFIIVNSCFICDWYLSSVKHSCASWQGVRLQFSRSQFRSKYIAMFLLIRDFSIFLISIYKAALLSCSLFVSVFQTGNYISQVCVSFFQINQKISQTNLKKIDSFFIFVSTGFFEQVFWLAAFRFLTYRKGMQSFGSLLR